MIHAPDIFPERVHIEVNTVDIEEGIPEASTACPIALAVERAFIDMHSDLRDLCVDVGSEDDSISVNVDSYGAEYAVARAVMKRAIRFDEGRGMDPFDFEMRRRA